MKDRTKKYIGWFLIAFVLIAIFGPFYYIKGFVVMTSILLIALTLTGMLVTGLYLVVNKETT